MIYSEKELTPSEIDRIWRHINSDNSDEDIFATEPKLLWQNDAITEFEFDFTFVLDDTEI